MEGAVTIPEEVAEDLPTVVPTVAETEMVETALRRVPAASALEISEKSDVSIVIGVKFRIS